MQGLQFTVQHEGAAVPPPADSNACWWKPNGMTCADFYAVRARGIFTFFFVYIFVQVVLCKHNGMTCAD